ncbi:MAG: hypothetical protein A2W01_07795 [Candidatus Solincola sediminis]|uniref:Uncharacterized protein n=1 Tax=Candidatus Solincola sediminis TaxID=1797199 RepID=A0A1F2WMB6_9ACTN|nr:MAG: hypothetical protein A2Y75_12080 [Candidatus Solincola sediminis]OFW61570.1 MAG: hypothetical protein A2W01_07795 [Candidatus Solincola sediminis]
METSLVAVRRVDSDPVQAIRKIFECFPAYKVVDGLDTCGRCDNILNIALRRLKASTFAMSPVSVPKTAFLLLVGKMKGLFYRFPR